MNTPNVGITLFEGMGRGVKALTSLPANSFVAEEELLVLENQDTTIVNTTELKHYTFVYSRGDSWWANQDCLVLGIGEIFNHSDTPNVRYELVNFEQEGESRKMMRFSTSRSIEAGEQLFIDYSADMAVEIQEYTDSKSMIGRGG